MKKGLLISLGRLISKMGVVNCSSVKVPKRAGFHEKGEVILITVNIGLIIIITLLHDSGTVFHSLISLKSECYIVNQVTAMTRLSETFCGQLLRSRKGVRVSYCL